MVIDNDSDIVAEKKNIIRKFWEVFTSSKRSITIGVISSLIASMIFYFAITHHNDIWRIVRTAVEWLWGLITYKVALPIWALLLALTLFTILTVGYKKKYRNIKETFKQDNQYNEDTQYNEDMFFGALWRWEWGNNGLKFLAPYCPVPGCETRLVCQHKAGDKYELFCETCGYKTGMEPGGYSDLEDRVMRQIERKLSLKLKEYEEKKSKELALLKKKSDEKEPDAINKEFEEKKNIQPYKAIYSKGNSWAVLFQKGKSHAAVGSHYKAIEFYKKALDIYPYAWAVWFQMAKSLDALDRHDEAIKAYEKAEKIKRDHPET